MRVYICMFPVEAGAEFPFNHIFQEYLLEQVTHLVNPSPWFSMKYGADWDLIFNISAKWSPDDEDTDRGVKVSEAEKVKLARYRTFTPEPLRVEVRGPTVFKKEKNVEYSLFLPFRRVNETADPAAAALDHIFTGVYTVLERMEIDTSRLRAEQQRIFDHICSEPKMFRMARHPGSGVGPPVWPIRSKE